MRTKMKIQYKVLTHQEGLSPLFKKYQPDLKVI